MNLLITIILTLLIWIASFYLLRRDVMSPSFLICSGFILSFLSTAYNYGYWGLNISFKACFIMLSGIIACVCGELVCNAVSKKRGGRIESASIEFISIGRAKMILVIVFCSLVVYLTMREVVRIASLSFVSYGNIAYNYKRNVVNTNLEGARVSSTVRYLNYLVKGIAYNFGYLFVNNWFASRNAKANKKKKIIENITYIIPCVLYSAQCIIKGGRFETIALIIGMVFVVYIFWRRIKGWDRKIPFKYIIRALTAIVIIMSIFWMSKELVGRIQIDKSMMVYVTRYLGGSTADFDMYLNDSSIVHDHYHETFANLVGNLNSLGITHISTRFSHEPRIAPSGVSIGNAYSAIRNYYHDFGYFGVLLLCFIFSFIFSKLYMKIRTNNRYDIKSIFLTIFYMSLVYMPLFYFFTDYFFPRLAIGYVAEIFLFWLSYYFIYRVSIRNKGRVRKIGIRSRI